MLVDGTLMTAEAGMAAGLAEELERRGYAGIWAAEATHDPFLPLVLAASRTSRLQVGTGIAVAFARSPMSTAYVANDLQLISQGRFLLGLGSQIRAHIEHRFSMPWGKPVARMREYIAALRAIWSSWQDGSRLAFRGDFYHHTVMTPFFSPGPNPYGPPPVFLAAVGPAMTRLAGEAADGLIVHAFTTERYLRERTIPWLSEGLAAAGRPRSALQLSYPGFVVTGRTDAERAFAESAVRGQIAFYGSTPAYRPVLELHGWQSLADELHELSVSGRDDRWQLMSGLIEPEVLNTFAVVADPDRLAGAIRERFGDLVDRFAVYALGDALDLWDPLISGLAVTGTEG